MSNGATIDTIDRILSGEAELPDKVSNALILAAVRANYQNVDKLICKVNDLEKGYTEQNAAIENLQKRSDRWDTVNTMAAALGSALGFVFGNK